ncbi:MAG: hypothetical protein WDZ44_00275 [Candidatus Spechtbacterales bacterium]
MEKTFSIKEALSFGWNVYKKDPIRWTAVFLGAPLALGVASELLSFVIIQAGIQANVVEPVFVVAGITVSILTAIAGIVLQVGIIKIALAAVDGTEWNWKDLYQHYARSWDFVFANIFYGLAVIGGLILFIFPGVIVAVALGMFRYAVVDKKAGPIESLKQSRAITKGVRWKIFFFIIVSGLVTVAGFIVLIVGALVAIPVVTLAGAWVYRQLERQTNTASSVAVEV